MINLIHMSNSNYMRLGDCIRPVDVRNRDMISDKPMGINIDKFFMPSVANVVGTDLSNYKVVEKNQFACNLMHVGRDERLPIAILEQDAPIIVSPAYYVFEIKPEISLMPSFLMLWFKRPEFDRNAWFYTDADVRGGLDRESFLDMIIPVPSIEEQQRIVVEYQAVEKRIATNGTLIAKLEETAQTIYKKLFVDDIDPENLPHGWRIGTLAELAGFRYGKLPEKHNESEEYHVPIYSGYAVTGYTNEVMFSDRVVVIIARGDAGTGRICLSPKECFLTNLAIAIITKDSNYTPFLYYYLSNYDTYSLRSGSAQAQITVNSLIPYKVLIPPVEVCKEFKRLISPFYDYSDSLNKEIKFYEDVKSVLLSRLTISA